MQRISFYCTSPSRGGLELNLINLAIEFKSKGYEILIITIQNSMIYELAMQNSLTVVCIKKPGKYFDVLSAYQINTLLTINNIKHLLVFSNRDTNCISLVKLISRNIKCYFHQNLQLGGKRQDFLHTFRYKQFDNWIVPTTKLIQEVSELTHYPKDRIKKIFYGINHQRFINMPTKEEAKQNLQICNKQFVVGIIGRIDYQKGQMVALEAINKMKNKNILLLIVGEQTINEGKEYYQELLDFIEKNNLTNRVKFIDFRTDIENIYASLDLFLLTSFSESYGLVTIEAMMSGVPIIATDVGGSIEITNQGEFAEVIKSNESNILRQKIEAVLDNYNYYKDRAERAKKYAFAHLTKDIESTMLIELFERNENE